MAPFIGLHIPKSTEFYRCIPLLPAKMYGGITKFHSPYIL